MRFVNRIWEGDDPAERLARAVLIPFEAVYRGVVAIRGELYDRSLAEVSGSSIAVVSIGNLTVGGTGKTPVAAWIASRLSDLGMKPGIVLRGYGGDEVMVHRRLNPGIDVVANVNRAAGIAAIAANGATVAVLDDAFQHRRAMRHVDIVLLSADSWTRKRRLLPAGPWREPLEAIQRASLVLITRKAAAPQQVADVLSALGVAGPRVPQAVITLAMDTICSATGTMRSQHLSTLSGKRILALSAIGNPGAFAAQLRALGADVINCAYPDHHAFSPTDVIDIVARSRPAERIVCTLKDAVKLGPIWPADAPPLWYVSQTVSIESGAAEIDRILARIQSHNSSQLT